MIDRLSRRDFVHGAGGLSAAVLLAPQAMAAAGKRRKPSLRGGKFARAWHRATRDPGPSRCGHELGDVEGTGTVEVQVARDHGFRKIVARDLSDDDATAHYAKARVAGTEAVRGLLLPLRHPRQREPGRAFPHRATA